MGVHSRARSKKLWNVLKVTLVLLARKGLISKRRFIMDMNLMIKRGKLFRKSVTNFMFHHPPSSSCREMAPRGGFGIQEYEFSCTNTPINPVICSKNYHSYFPCINFSEETKQEEEEAEEEETFVFPFSKAYESPEMVANYYTEEEEEIGSENGQVDNQAEEFIRRFYEQLKMQRRLQYC